MSGPNEKTDDEFYDRADEHIHLSNDQIKGEIGSGKVSASMMYATARFNAWVSACGFEEGKDLKQEKDEILDYFLTEYRKMLEDNLDDYINNFNNYMK